MKRITGTLRIATLALIVGLLFAGGESQSAASPATSPGLKTNPVAMTPASSHATGGALVLGAYGFLLMLRRRNLR